MAWLAVVLAAARESFQVKDLGAELTPLLFLFVTLSASRRSIGANINFAWLSDLSLRTAISGGSLSRTGACLHASRSRVCCFEPVFFAIQRRSVTKMIQCSSPYIYIYKYIYIYMYIYIYVYIYAAKDRLGRSSSVKFAGLLQV